MFVVIVGEDGEQTWNLSNSKKCENLEVKPLAADSQDSSLITVKIEPLDIDCEYLEDDKLFEKPENVDPVDINSKPTRDIEIEKKHTADDILSGILSEVINDNTSKQVRFQEEGGRCKPLVRKHTRRRLNRNVKHVAEPLLNLELDEEYQTKEEFEDDFTNAECKPEKEEGHDQQNSEKYNPWSTESETQNVDFQEELEHVVETQSAWDLKDEGPKKDMADLEISHCDNKNIKVKYAKAPRRRQRKQDECESFVAELKRQNPELRKNKKLLVDTLADIMSNIKSPEVPENCYKFDGSKFRCHICKLRTTSPYQARRHYQDKHGPRYLVCFACGIDFRGTMYLYRHEKRCSGVDAGVVLRARAQAIGTKARNRPYIPARSRKPTKADSLLCLECSAVFSSKVALMAHENLHRGERPYQCDSCLNAYTSSQALYHHVKKKHSNAEYICDHCNRSFPHRSSIIAHMYTHNARKRFSCSVCSRPFAHKAALVRHEDKLHRKLPPPCPCPVCNKRYMRMTSLKKHVEEVHGLKLVTRNKFLKTLPSMPEPEVQKMLGLVNS